MQHSIPKEVSIDFYNGSNPEYYFIIKELAKEFKKQFTCLGENTEKRIIFSFPMQKKVTRIGKGRGGRAKKVFTQIYSLGVFELFLMTGINKLKFIFCANWGKCGFCRSKNAKIQTSLFIRSFLKFSLVSGI